MVTLHLSPVGPAARDIAPFSSAHIHGTHGGEGDLRGIHQCRAVSRLTGTGGRNFSIQLPDSISCDESEFCVMLSNFLENSIEAAESYINLKIKFYNSQLSINIENDYSGTLKKDSSGWYVTTKPEGSGLGLKSANAILKKNRGFLKIDDSKGVFRLFATMKN